MAAGPPEHQLAGRLRASADDVVHHYEQSLSTLHSPLLATDFARGQALAHARQIVENSAQFIDGTAEGPAFDLAREIGVERAATGVHPGESLRASYVLFEAVMQVVGPGLSGSDAVLVCLALQRILTDVLRAAADSYAGVLLSRIHSAHIEERRRISRELHDRIAHGVILAQRDLEFFELTREQDEGRALHRVQRAKQGLTETVGAVRQIISDLRLVEPLESLEKALKLFFEASGTSLVSRIVVNGNEEWASPDVIEEVFLIVREALRNTIAHAGAQHVLVRVDIAPYELRAQVTDDGIGFDPAVGRPGGTGLLSMRERAALLGGRVTMTSHRNRGTSIELTVPLSRGT